MSIKHLASLLASHKLIPFLGAGCSYGHLNVDWDKLSVQMAQITDSKSSDNLEIAEDFIKAKGTNAFCKFLKEKLYVDKYNEELDITPLTIINTGIGLIYTTNQDNVLEECIKKYGRSYDIISSLQHLGEHKPGRSMLVKYHGDLNDPDSVIFTKSSYDNRIQNTDHFLNIRMRSDLLAKGFIFFGYSFRDPNIRLVFKQLQKAFQGIIPTSYLIAFQYTSELEELTKEFGITIINPRDEITDANNAKDAFERYVSTLCENIHRKKVDEEISSLFRPDIPPAIRTISKYEVSSIEKSLETDQTLSKLIKQFRLTFDISQIPECFQQRVADVFLELCKRCNSRDTSDELKAALFHLYLNFDSALTAVAGVWTTCLYREKTSGFDPFSVIVQNFPDEAYPLAIAQSVELIKNWGLEMNDSFREKIIMAIKGYNLLPDDAQMYIKEQMDWAWSTHTTYENPIKYWERLGHKTGFESQSYNQIRRRIENSFAKKSSKPYEE